MRKSNPESEANIKRIDTKSRAKKQTHGFQVHFLRSDQVITKMFSDSVHGGKEGARRAARRFKRTAMGNLSSRTKLGPVKKSKPARKKPASRKKPAARKPVRRKAPARKPARAKGRKTRRR